MDNVKITNTGKLDEYIKNLAVQKAKIDVGFFEGANYPNKEETSVVKVAIANEYGIPENNQPPRPFMKQTYDTYAGKWRDIFGKLLIKNKYDTKKSMGQMGLIIQGQIQDTISNGHFVPNAASTIAKKGKDTPLKDTLVMQRSVTYKVTT